MYLFQPFSSHFDFGRIIAMTRVNAVYHVSDGAGGFVEYHISDGAGGFVPFCIRNADNPLYVDGGDPFSVYLNYLDGGSPET